LERIKFEEPQLTVSRFAVEDIVTTSNTLFDGGAGDNPVAALFGMLFG